MKTLRKLAPVLVILLLLSSLLCALSSCSVLFPGDTADYVADELSAFDDLPQFDKGKLKRIEQTVRAHTVLDLADAKEAAETVHTLYKENFSDLNPENKTAVTDALIHCYVASLGDRYAYYRTAEEYEQYETDMSGEFCGIGVEVQYDARQNTVQVLGIYDGSPAAEAGVRVGDYIVGVGGKTIEELGYSALVSAIRGEEGTEVSVMLLRDGKTLTATATRRKIVEQSVRYAIDNGIGYVRISSFKANTATLFREAIDALESAGVLGIVFDLRSNPGGYLQAVVSVLSYLVPMGTRVVSYVENDKVNHPIYASGEHRLTVPSVVLCNEYTASAGELFTAAMRDYNESGVLRATVVGTKTYGKGVMQNSYSYSDGSSLTITMAYYNPPSGNNYDGKGITPSGKNYVEASEGEDLQLARGYEALRELLAETGVNAGEKEK